MQAPLSAKSKSIAFPLKKLTGIEFKHFYNYYRCLQNAETLTDKEFQKSLLPMFEHSQKLY
ncbi:hypothetical protein DSM106972_006870 [Dulcicalothrix desertica PCC 7102]|uniref:Uncharacterized protein n=1 Tax=Dulcicalothrix desertica PCC 7102 TaxID=232991 RepID=A0A3S1DHY3_9CYAN|nr:hypothetical protein DSM106972_006870 [Dulcicalothrix desertica PCC 7102]